MSAWLQREWAQAREQLEANPRLRLGVLAIPLIALLYLNLLLGDARSEQQQAIRDLQEQLLDAGQLAGQDEWVERLDQAHARLDDQAKRHFGSADSEAFARADIQASAQALLAEQNLEQIRIEVSTAGKADPATGLIPLQLRLAGNAQGEQLYALITAMETGKPTYRIDNLNVQAQRDSHLVFSLIGTAWHRPWSSAE
ncbi:GspMb/PilO family protein [Stutzerimonas sp. R75]|uniref:GspMb/PilO family protein n=1 Tax=Stutzerimonas sp. R75 TaxID=3439498 RepID=UPI0037D70E57